MTDTSNNADAPNVDHQPEGTNDNKSLSDLINDMEAMADRIERWFDEMKEDPRPISDTAAAYWRLKVGHDGLKAALTRIYHVKNNMEKGYLPQRLESEGLDMIRVPELGRSFSRKQMFSASILDKEEGIEWLKKNGQMDIVQETVNAGTLASLARNMELEEGKSLPDNLFKVTTYEQVVSQKYNPAKKK